MINIREVDRAFGLIWLLRAVAGAMLSVRDLLTSQAVQRCQRADGLSVDFNQERIRIREFSASVENEYTFTSTSSIHLHDLLFRTVFLNRRTAARYRALASIIRGRERFSWNLSF